LTRGVFETDLNGQIRVVLHGRTDSVHGGIRNTFEGVPDARFQIRPQPQRRQQGPFDQQPRHLRTSRARASPASSPPTRRSRSASAACARCGPASA